MLTKIQRNAIPLFIFTLIILVFAISSADSGKMPGSLAYILEIRNMDKIGHFFLMGVFACLANLAYKDKSFKILNLRIPIAIIIVSLIVGAEEYSQRFFPSRTSSWIDFSASLLGIILIGWVGSQWTMKHLPE
jgi:hypothetical protein